MEGEDRTIVEEAESFGTHGESLAGGVGVTEVAESSNALGPEANKEERPMLLVTFSKI